MKMKMTIHNALLNWTETSSDCHNIETKTEKGSSPTDSTKNYGQKGKKSHTLTKICFVLGTAAQLAFHTGK